MRNKPEIKLDHGHHRDQEVVLIRFDYNTRLKKYYNYTQAREKKRSKFKNPLDDLFDENNQKSVHITPFWRYIYT